MKKGWEVKKLSEIGKVFNGNSINEKVKKDRYLNIKNGLPYIANIFTSHPFFIILMI